MTADVIVARTRSRRGGKLDCGHRVSPGGDIAKVDVGERGTQTQWRNGRGVWLCAACVASGLAEGTLTEAQPV